MSYKDKQQASILIIDICYIYSKHITTIDSIVYASFIDFKSIPDKG